MNRQQRRQEMRSARRAKGPVNSSRSPIKDLFQSGLVGYQAGRLQQAQAACHQIATIDPTHADALHFLGLIAHQSGRNDLAISYIRQAIELHSVGSGGYSKLGKALRDFRLVRPDLSDAHHALGNALFAFGRPAEAATSYRETLKLRPNYPEAHANLGNALYTLGRPAEAEVSYREALRLRPDYYHARNNLGALLHALGQSAEAEANFRKALRLRPDYPEVHHHLGIVLQALGRLAEAEASCREALRLRPNYPEAHANLGNALYALGQPAEAETSYREALRLKPDLPDVRYHIGHALLLAGRFEEGWEEYEWRWKSKQLSWSARNFQVPRWNGEEIRDRTILLHAEQGLGDTLQFCRYVPLVASNGGVILEVQAPLVRLLSRLPGVTKIVARGDSLPPFDLHCPLLSLPLAFGTALDTIPAATPYLSAAPALTAYWQERLASLGGFRIGLVWAGSQRSNQSAGAALDRRRSIALDTMAPLSEVSDVSLISLQKEAPAAQTSGPPRGITLHDFTAELHDFEDTAALVANLDLVISVDTSVAHLAGALNKPVWLLNRFDTCWRWLLDRDDSPWYPTLRQFRQPSPGDWNSVMCAVRDALQRLVAGDRDQLRALPPQGLERHLRA
jgi:Flp pilus assembly protein TadD